MAFVGELAALGTSLCFSLSSILFTFSGREVGSLVVNRLRLLVAVLVMLLLHTLSFGMPLPIHAESERWFWLGLSGFIGLALGDAFLFQAFVLIGPRLAMLMMALSPALGVLFAWLFLGETLVLSEIVGVGITLGGIMLVLAARREGSQTEATNQRHYLIGLLCGLGAAVGQAGGLVLSKIGLRGGFPVLSGNLIRLLIALAAVWALAAVNRQLVSSYRIVRAHPRVMLLVTGGAVLGPVLGVWLTLFAIQNTNVGIVSTLSSLMPIFLIPISYVVFGERVTRQAVLGTIITIGGMIVLFLA
jgi:drug/metabolite transporter (DMT)-like permease